MHTHVKCMSSKNTNYVFFKLWDHFVEKVKHCFYNRRDQVYFILFHCIISSYFILFFYLISSYFFILFFHLIFSSYFILFHCIISSYFILFHLIFSSYLILFFHLISSYFILFHLISYYFILFHLTSFYFISFYFTRWPVEIKMQNYTTVQGATRNVVARYVVQEMLRTLYIKMRVMNLAELLL